jgi:hypothetical protein
MEIIEKLLEQQKVLDIMPVSGQISNQEVEDLRQSVRLAPSEETLSTLTTTTTETKEEVVIDLGETTDNTEEEPGFFSRLFSFLGF